MLSSTGSGEVRSRVAGRHLSAGFHSSRLDFPGSKAVGLLYHQQTKRTFVQGNHDWGVAERKDPRASPLYSQLAAATQAFCLTVLPPKLQAFLRSLPHVVSFYLGNSRCFACHAKPSGPLFHYMHGSDKELENELEIADWPEFLFVGHTHWPFVRSLGKSVIVNPGSVGQPKDGDPSASYAVWEDGQVKLRRASYPIEATVQSYAYTPLRPSDVNALITVLKTGGQLPA